MKIEKVQVHADRKFNHPFEQYSNLSSGVSLVATLDEGEDYEDVVKQLQAKAEEMAEQHKRIVLAEVERMQELTQAQERYFSLEREIIRAQAEFERMKNRFPELSQMPLPEGQGVDT